MTNVTLFAQIIQTLDRFSFVKLVKKYQSDKHRINCILPSAFSELETAIALFPSALFLKKRHRLEEDQFLDGEPADSRHI